MCDCSGSVEPIGDILHCANTSPQLTLLTLRFCRCEWKQVLRVICHSGEV